MKRRILNILLIMALLMAAVTSVFAQDNQATAASEDAKSYIVVMAHDPLVAFEGEAALTRQYQAFLQIQQDASLKAAGVGADAKIHSYTHALNGYSAIMTEAQAKAVELQSGVVMVLEDQMRYLDTDGSAKFMQLTVPGGAYDTGFTGEDVIVGIIDSGIWPEHPSFADDGSYEPLDLNLDDSRPICEFGNMAHNPADAPFECNNKLIVARQMIDTYRALIGAEPYEYDSARDDNGHGTHTASTAAGNAGVEAEIYGLPVGTISGIAPRARIFAYKGLGDLGGFTSDLVSAIDQAVADGVHVINYSIGGGAGVPGGDEIAFLFAEADGVHIATSAGNSGPGAATLGNPGTMPWMTTVGASTQRRFFTGAIKLFRGPRISGASITAELKGWQELVDAESATVDGDDRCLPGTLDPAVVTGKVVLCRRGAIARADKSRAVDMAGGAGMIMYNNDDVGTLATDSHWVPSVHIDYTPGIVIKDYIASSANPRMRLETGTHKGPHITSWTVAPSMTSFSSRGPNPVSPDLIKPDITAPGTQILAGYSPTPAAAYDIKGELFAAIQGTSMSSPQVAGIFALLKQAHPDWTPAMAKSALMTTAYQKVRDNDRVSMADPFDMGAGHANPGGLWDKRGSIVQPGLVYDAGFYEYAAYTCGEEFGVFDAASCDLLESIGVPSEPYNLNVPSIGVFEVAGSQTVVRTVTSVADKPAKFRAKVVAPPGYDVTVTPNKFELEPGESITFEVTITNDGSGEIGEWSFGSLTWIGDGSYKVYSPIAVRGALFSAPAAVTGAGAMGTASFDVLFGYTGSYAAAAHGLEAETITSDFVGQDPDQTYPSVDDAPPGVLKYDFPIAGAAFARWELVIPGDDDIDLFLEDSSGTIVAASTSGGTDELIELWLPADDIYTMVVHGWSVPNQPLAFEMSSWVVPLASGGSLNLDAAPTAAVVGTTGTVDLSWSGLATGNYLGAVSHTGDAGLMGFTLIEVTVEAPAP